MGGPPGYGSGSPQDRSGAYGPRGPMPPGAYGPGSDPYGPGSQMPPGGWGKPGMRPPFRPEHMRGPGPMQMRPVSFILKIQVHKIDI